MSSPRELSRSLPRRPFDSHVVAAIQWTGSTSMKEELPAETYPTLSAMGRREHRHVQSLREEDRTTRQKQGKKPFYLTLDFEGKPHGPSKPA